MINKTIEIGKWNVIKGTRMNTWGGCGKQKFVRGTHKDNDQCVIDLCFVLDYQRWETYYSNGKDNDIVDAGDFNDYSEETYRKLLKRFKRFIREFNDVQEVEDVVIKFREWRKEDKDDD